MATIRSICLVFGLLLGLAIACLGFAAAAGEPMGFIIDSDMPRGEGVVGECSNTITGDSIPMQIITPGSRTVFDLNVLDPNAQHLEYNCLFTPISYSGNPDNRMVSHVIWAIGSYSTALPQGCAVCFWKIDDSGISIKGNGVKTFDKYILVASWEPLQS